VVSSTPRPHFTPGKNPVPILQEAGWVPGPVWVGGKSRPQRESIPDRPARSSVTIPTELPGPYLPKVLLAKYERNDQSEEDTMDRVCSMNGRYEKCIQGFDKKTLRKKTAWEIAGNAGNSLN
jgi:hypothetical protein